MNLTNSKTSQFSCNETAFQVNQWKHLSRFPRHQGNFDTTLSWVNLSDQRYGDILLTIFYKLQNWLCEKMYWWHCCFCPTALQSCLWQQKGFHCSLLFHRGLWGPGVIYIHTQGRTAINSVCMHKILFFSSKTPQSLCTQWALGYRHRFF